MSKSGDQEAGQSRQLVLGSLVSLQGFIMLIAAEIKDSGDQNSRQERGNCHCDTIIDFQGVVALISCILEGLVEIGKSDKAGVGTEVGNKNCVGRSYLQPGIEQQSSPVQMSLKAKLLPHGWRKPTSNLQHEPSNPQPSGLQPSSSQSQLNLDPEHTRVDPAFDDECAWPRRLLHISTLTSYPWRPGNIYGGKEQPQYHAITYTWGRWQLSPDSHPSITALDFGTPWKIPRVDPARFTKEQFVNLIRSLPSSHRKGMSGAYYDVPVEFVWLDVACIDQRNGSREKELEVGRQAAIFKGAHSVYAWLHEFENAEVEKIFAQFCKGYRFLSASEDYVKGLSSGLQKSGKAAVLEELDAPDWGFDLRKARAMADWRGLSFEPDVPAAILPETIAHDPQLATMNEMVKNLTKQSGMFTRSGKPPKKVQEPKPTVDDLVDLLDLARDLKQCICTMIESMESFAKEPWFSSLWTLQEAYLRSDAHLRDRDGQPWIKRISKWSDFTVLSDFTDFIDEVGQTLDASFFRDVRPAQALRTCLENSGCMELRARLPTILLRASQKRTVKTKRANDRVYGIMQVFNLKLGRSAPDCPPDREFDLNDLQDQLGAALIAKSPIMSQMFFHTKPVPPGKGWRIGPHVGIPKLASRMDAFLTDEADIGARIDSRTEVSVTTVGGTIVGDTVVGRTVVGYFSGPTCNMTALHQTLIGFGPKIDASFEFDELSPFDMSQDGSKIEALLLGICSQGSRPTTAVCLLLSPSADATPVTEWKRQGLMFWDLEDPVIRNLDQGQREMMQGVGRQWQHRIGTFG
ncbi:hypothetical protein P152DRAFT_516830 [Eremomyces bilateralis CBS 781.70]|uniref:Heterokaryon incompatibility domain-containing protein n=1 Tax=Eremomyces bilateralis CBS 781.70 TaxID=1392243 RepID=A0A6G1FTW9_9PEZI|nr:uncharacterized protein P152DRAFT_516830 [Eremomyces bilateralis CBS 781.70]KAF1809214.1 hypothetical protein P152DRAFT_516830 [Eremomyces bilateralis CBS 781.70]